MTPPDGSLRHTLPTVTGRVGGVEMEIRHRRAASWRVQSPTPVRPASHQSAPGADHGMDGKMDGHGCSLPSGASHKGPHGGAAETLNPRNKGPVSVDGEMAMQRPTRRDLLGLLVTLAAHPLPTVRPSSPRDEILVPVREALWQLTLQ